MKFGFILQDYITYFNKSLLVRECTFVHTAFENLERKYFDQSIF